MAHWHDHNPWADRLVYLPDIDELSACLDPYNPTRHAKGWRKQHKKLDAYILRQPNGEHSCGVRFGKRGESYYSPHINPYIAALLLTKYA